MMDEKMTTVKEYFEWKLNNSVAIEDMYPDNEIIMAWERRDVLYSFIGIYQIGLSILYPDLFYRTKYQVKRFDLKKVFGLDYLVEEVNGKCRYEQFATLNKILEEKGFVKAIVRPGNIIPIWPGGNTDRGQRGHCFDIPDLYFGNWPRWFKTLCNLYPEASLQKIKNASYSIGTVEFLNKVNDIASYEEFLEHIVTTIQDRTKLLSPK